jgi:hypothetical protein
MNYRLISPILMLALAACATAQRVPEAAIPDQQISSSSYLAGTRKHDQIVSIRRAPFLRSARPFWQ